MSYTLCMSFEANPTNESVPEPQVEFFDPSEQSWDDVKDDIMRLEELCFPGHGLGEEYLKEKFEDQESIIVLLKKGEKLIGFSYTTPDENSENSAYIDTTEIEPDEQGKGYVVPLITKLEDEARNRGYKFITRNAARENGYADMIMKNYGDRIVETYENDSEFGPQRYFKISL